MEVKPGYRKTDVGVIPEDWEVVPLGDLGQCSSGGTPRKSEQRFWDGEIPWVSAKDMKSSRLSDAIDHVTEIAIGHGTRLVEAGTILMVVRGMSLAHSFPVAIVERSMAFNQDIKAFVVHNNVNNDFVLRWLQANQGKLLSLTTVATHGTKRMPTADLLGSCVPLPEPREQRAISGALTDVDELIGGLEKLISKKRQIKKGAMQQLLTGKTRLPGFSGEWRTQRLSDIADIDSENLASGTDPGYTFNYISLEQVDAGRLLGYSEEKFGNAPTRARRVLRFGDVLMSTVRPNLMAHMLFLEQIENAVCSTGFAVLRARRNLAVPGFLGHHLFSHFVNSQIEKTLAGSNYPAINGSDVRAIEILCPPDIEEQSAIAAILSGMDAEIAALERRRDKTRAIKRGMMQELLTGRIRLL